MAQDSYMRTQDIKFEWDRSNGLGSTIGDRQTRQTDRQTDRHTHTHTHTDIFSKTHF